jgi:hypothetical protein
MNNTMIVNPKSLLKTSVPAPPNLLHNSISV